MKRVLDINGGGHTTLLMYLISLPYALKNG
jgi:hypothetical protein